jgi:hypothetical protein
MCVCVSVCLSVRPSALTELFNEFFRKSVDKTKVPSNPPNNNRSVTDGQSVFTTAAHRSIIVIIRYNSDKHYKKATQNVIIHAIYKIMCKTQYSRTGHR